MNLCMTDYVPHLVPCDTAATQVAKAVWPINKEMIDSLIIPVHISARGHCDRLCVDTLWGTDSVECGRLCALQFSVCSGARRKWLVSDHCIVRPDSL